MWLRYSPAHTNPPSTMRNTHHTHHQHHRSRGHHKPPGSVASAAHHGLDYDSKLTTTAKSHPRGRGRVSGGRTQRSGAGSGSACSTVSRDTARVSATYSRCRPRDSAAAIRAGSTTMTWSNSRPLARVTGTRVSSPRPASASSTECRSEEHTSELQSPVH